FAEVCGYRLETPDARTNRYGLARPSIEPPHTGGFVIAHVPTADKGPSTRHFPHTENAAVEIGDGWRGAKLRRDHCERSIDGRLGLWKSSLEWVAHRVQPCEEQRLVFEKGYELREVHIAPDDLRIILRRTNDRREVVAEIAHRGMVAT